MDLSRARPSKAAAVHPQCNTTMPSSDYTAATGGALKLKGGGVDKRKKKKKPKTTESTKPSEDTSTSVAKRSTTDDNARKSPSGTPGRSVSPETAERSIREGGGRQKTEAERRYDEMRRKRLEEKLKKEGVKTHKEKVEELNKYLSGLSEHHDMPKIGPG
jgi:protein FAM32A